MHRMTKLSFKNTGAQQEKNDNKKRKQSTQRHTDTQESKELASKIMLLGFARTEMETWYQWNGHHHSIYICIPGS